MKGSIFDIKRFAVHDGPGIRTTVFFKGCPLKCVWCHNPEGLSFEGQTAFYPQKCIGCGQCRRKGFVEEDCLGEARVRYGQELDVEELLTLVLEDKDFYQASGGGVTLSGGECLCQADACAQLLRRLKENGVHTAVDTCGFVPRDALDKVIGYTDLFLYDLKAIDEAVHIRCTGRGNAQILENLKYLDSCHKSIHVRSPYVPGYNDGQMEKIAQFLKPFKHLQAVEVLPYHNYAGSKYQALGMENTLPTLLPTDDEIERARQLIQRVLAGAE